MKKPHQNLVPELGPGRAVVAAPSSKESPKQPSRADARFPRGDLLLLNVQPLQSMRDHGHGMTWLLCFRRGSASSGFPRRRGPRKPCHRAISAQAVPGPQSSPTSSHHPRDLGCHIGRSRTVDSTECHVIVCPILVENCSPCHSISRHLSPHGADLPTVYHTEEPSDPSGFLRLPDPSGRPCVLKTSAV